MTRQFRASLFVAVTALVGLHFKPCIGTMFGAVSEALACSAAACELPAEGKSRVALGASSLPAPDATCVRPTLASLAVDARVASAQHVAIR